MSTDVDAPSAPDADADVLVAGYHVSSFGYRPELDGLRAVAVVSVLLYHGSVWWATGGFLGVDLFFVLSGYLITTLLLLERDKSGTIGLRAFWGRRLRRLLPALLVVLVWVAVYARFFADPIQVEALRGDALASLLYVANWRFVFSGASYFDQFLAPSPLRHMWSLAIEEQWYIFWPIVVMVGLGFTQRARTWLIGIGLATVASAGLMVALYDPDADPSRVYYGTDARAQALLIGAGLAFALRSTQGRGAVPLSVSRQRVLVAGGIVGGLVVVAFLFVLAADDAPWMYRGGFTLFALAAAVLIAGTVQPGPNPLRTVLAFGPLPAIGRISYGLYLYHWPVYVFLTEERTGIDGDALLWLRLGVTVVVSVISYHVVEMPIRRGNLGITKPLVPVLATISAVVLLVFVGTASTGSTSSQASTVDTPAREGDLKVMIVGDSVAESLAAGFSPAADGAMNVSDRSIPGCGVVDLQQKTIGPPQFFVDCDDFQSTWQQDVEAYQPDVVLVLIGGREVYNHFIDGTLRQVGSEEYRAYLLDRLDLAVDTLSSTGARVVFLTPPCYKVEGKPGASAPIERTDPARSQWIADVVAEAAAARPAEAGVIDLRGHVCPSGQHEASLDGVELYRDGMHFKPTGAQTIWTWLAPEIRSAVGDKASAAAAGGGGGGGKGATTNGKGKGEGAASSSSTTVTGKNP